MCDSLSSRPLINLQQIFHWSRQHYRDRTFSKNEKIPTRSGLLYIVDQGVVRLTGVSHVSLEYFTEDNQQQQETKKEKFLSFVSQGQPFEIIDQSQFNLQAYAHIDGTSVIWLYWHDLDNWPHIRREVFEVFRYQHQRKLLWLNILGKKQTIDRLIGFLHLLIEEYGQVSSKGKYIPFPLTHSLIATAIHSTRVTVTRLMAKLRQKGLIVIEDDNLIYFSK